MKTIVLASNNPGKAEELLAFLKGLSVKIVLQKDLGIPSPEETGETFIENALLKARYVSQLTGLPAIADDSGLSVDALEGAPGIYSARYAGEHATSTDRIQKLLLALEEKKALRSKASFHCVLAFLRQAHDPIPIVAHGMWEGTILESPRGKNGFGYDPIFYDSEYSCSAAEMEASLKNRISHRARAMESFIPSLKKYLGDQS